MKNSIRLLDNNALTNVAIRSGTNPTMFHYWMSWHFSEKVRFKIKFCIFKIGSIKFEFLNAIISQIFEKFRIRIDLRGYENRSAVQLMD